MVALTGGSVLSGLTKVKDSVLFDSLVSSECARRMTQERRNSIKTLLSCHLKKKRLWTNKHKDIFFLVLIRSYLKDDLILTFNCKTKLIVCQII